MRACVARVRRASVCRARASCERVSRACDPCVRACVCEKQLALQLAKLTAAMDSPRGCACMRVCARACVGVRACVCVRARACARVNVSASTPQYFV